MLPIPAGASRISSGGSSVGLSASSLSYRFHSGIHSTVPYDTLTFLSGKVAFFINLVGSDRVVIGTDNYAPMDVGEPDALVDS